MDSGNNNGPERKTDIVRKNILLGVTGSVAALKSPEIAVRLNRELNVNVRILLTRGGENFWEKSAEYNPHWWDELQKELVKNTKNNNNDNSDLGKVDDGPFIQLIYSHEEWANWHRLGDDVMHIELRNWCHALLVAPLSAHTLAKLSQGSCDDVLSCVARAWEFHHHHPKPMILCPAMNTEMWQHPITAEQLTKIQSFFRVGNQGEKEEKEDWCWIVSPQIKTLACGQYGNGALAAVSDIIEAVGSALRLGPG